MDLRSCLCPHNCKQIWICDLLTWPFDLQPVQATLRVIYDFGFGAAIDQYEMETTTAEPSLLMNLKLLKLTSTLNDMQNRLECLQTHMDNLPQRILDTLGGSTIHQSQRSDVHSAPSVQSAMEALTNAILSTLGTVPAAENTEDAEFPPLLPASTDATAPTSCTVHVATPPTETPIASASAPTISLRERHALNVRALSQLPPMDGIRPNEKIQAMVTGTCGKRKCSNASDDDSPRPSPIAAVDPFRNRQPACQKERLQTAIRVSVA
ncbi:Aste57867_13037 [Aphanomyces stellatus]|uniref:Aste57867_13037 protein n=1 Tax=Aphanomyces stellatus TaxID=120398 RepID=A0A485KXF8_9STRA|nr:hypothetical protein As57867_012989 [Aphanomyces stellatus]VFT89882.1 Aste57867_13037 [Aphanomyces stellatus]